MKSKFVSLLAIILGLIIIIFPIMGVIGVADLIGLSLLLISIYLLVVGVAIIDYNKSGAILDLILGIPNLQIKQPVALILVLLQLTKQIKIIQVALISDLLLQMKGHLSSI